MLRVVLTNPPDPLGTAAGHPVSPLRTCVCLASFLQREEYHTRLALLYLDAVLQRTPGTIGLGAEVMETQAKLRHLLQKSDLYRVHFLMGEEELMVSMITCGMAGAGEGFGITPVIPWVIP